MKLQEAEAMREIDSGLLYKEPDLKLQPQDHAVENPPAQAPEAASAQTNGASSPETEEPTAPTIPTAPTAADAAANQQTETSAAPPQTAEPPKQPKDPEAVAKSAIGDTAAQVKSVTDIIGKDMTVQSLKYEQQYKGAYKLAALMENGMMMFQDGTAPARFTENAGEYLTDPEEINKEVQRFRQEGDALKQKYGDFHGKAYLAGMLGKIAGGVGHVVDFHELGKRAGTAYDSGKDSDWDAVVGQLAKMATNVAGGVASLGVARVIGIGLTAMGIPAVISVGVTLGLGAAAVYGISKLADYIDSEISNGRNPFDFSSLENNTEIILAGNADYSKYGMETLIKADNLTLIGKHKFHNLEVDSNKLTLIGDIESEGKMIINSEKVDVLKNEINELSVNGNVNVSIDNNSIDDPVLENSELVSHDDQNVSYAFDSNLKDNGFEGDVKMGNAAEPFKLDPTVHMNILDGNASISDKNQWYSYVEWVMGNKEYYTESGEMTLEAYNDFVQSLLIV